MATLEDLITALNAVASEHEIDTEAGEDVTEEGGNNFRSRYPRQSEKLLAKVQHQAGGVPKEVAWNQAG
jgi:hypothetical protein